MKEWTRHNSCYKKLTSKDETLVILLQDTGPQCKKLLIPNLNFKTRKNALKAAQIIMRLIDSD